MMNSVRDENQRIHNLVIRFILTNFIQHPIIIFFIGIVIFWFIIIGLRLIPWNNILIVDIDKIIFESKNIIFAIGIIPTVFLANITKVNREKIEKGDIIGKIDTFNDFLKGSKYVTIANFVYLLMMYFKSFVTVPLPSITAEILLQNILLSFICVTISLNIITMIPMIKQFYSDLEIKRGKSK